MVKKTMQYFNKFKNKYFSKDDNRLFLFRFFSVLLMLNFVAVLILTKTSLSYFLNPFAFLTDTAGDQRVKAVYVLPLSIQFDSGKKNIEEFTSAVLYPHANEKKKTDEILIPQKAEALLDVLIGGIRNPRAAKISIKKTDIRRIWFYQKTLVIDVKENIWQNISPDDKNVFQECIEKTLRKNLSDVKKIDWYYFKDENTN